MRLDGLGTAQTLDRLAEIPASAEFGAIEHFVEPGSGDQWCLAAILVGLEHRREIGELLLQRARQRRVDAVAHRHETRPVARGAEER
ncbi:MAG: hypothetical protein AW07_02046 [Candidatus Accumulibacter sp. SK-11]|nr:MAG: hypothetical protein AW07_02046 [Candidatus Accumulibacter sp. SK-11]